eukprot:TRINITY_DN91980_c0_g1_i1.p1 TRINITY_DN91980_c0_g1~~TRINITY_DN91980_c0_g1_i1.p1  ORF type:complete len:830 (+),score=241.76 TRINITY_DN91980_c0_g1_i1:97-2586(+)
MAQDGAEEPPKAGTEGAAATAADAGDATTKPATSPRPLDELMLSKVRKRLRAKAAVPIEDEDKPGNMEAFFKRNNTDGSGDLNMEQLRTAVRRSLKLNDHSLPEDVMPSLFRALDVNKDGKVTLDDLSRFTLSRQGDKAAHRAFDVTTRPASAPTSPPTSPVPAAGADDTTKPPEGGAEPDTQAAEEERADFYSIVKFLVFPKSRPRDFSAEEAANIMAKINARINEEDGRQWLHNWEGPGTALEAAVNADHAELVQILLANRAEATAETKRKCSLLHMAAFKGNEEICSMLLRNLADPNAVDPHGQTPIFFAGNTKVCMLLLKRTADINAINVFGQTCLHLTAKAGLASVLEWMSQRCHESVLQLKDKYGASAYYYGRHAGITDCKLRELKLFQPNEKLSRRAGRNALSEHNDWTDKNPRSGIEKRKAVAIGKDPLLMKHKTLAMPTWLAKRDIHDSSDEGEESKETAPNSPSDSMPGSPTARSVPSGTTSPRSPKSGRLPAKPKPALEQQFLASVRSRLKAASHMYGDGSTESLVKLLQFYDADQSGELDLAEFSVILRKALKIPKSVLRDNQIGLLMSYLDPDGSGHLSVDELVEFVDPVYGQQRKLMQKVNKRLEKNDVDAESLEELKTAIRAITTTDREHPGTLLDEYLASLVKNTRGVFSVQELIEVSRKNFKIQESQLSDAQLKEIFEAFKDKNGEVQVDEIMDLLDMEREMKLKRGGSGGARGKAASRKTMHSRPWTEPKPLSRKERAAAAAAAVANKPQQRGTLSPGRSTKVPENASGEIGQPREEAASESNSPAHSKRASGVKAKAKVEKKKEEEGSEA